MWPSASHNLSLRAVTGLVQVSQVPQSSPQPQHALTPMVQRRARLLEMASLPSCAKCHKTFNSHTRPRNSARKALPLRPGASNAHGGCGTDAQQAHCRERQAEIRQGCRAARCAPAVGSYSLEGQQPGLQGHPAASLADLRSGGAPAPPACPAPQGAPEPAGMVTGVCK